MNEVTVFNFNQSHVRTVVRDGEPWFVAKDVCDVLEINNVGQALVRIPDHHKGVSLTDTLGGKQRISVISESGLYRLVLRSDKPQAEPFIEWVTSEVLPAIRKTGKYKSPSVPQPSTSTELAEREFLVLKRMAELFGLTHNRALISANIALRKRTGIDFQAELDVKLIAEDNSNYLLATEIGERLHMGIGRKAARHANLLLAEEGFQFRNERNEWRPTEKGRAYAVILDTGKAHHDGSMVQQLRWKENIVNMLQSCVKQYWKINNL